MTNNNKILKCPACGEEMTKVFIESVKVDVDICINGCGGVFFDNREFNLFDEKHEDISGITNELKGKDLKPVDTSKERYCPNCGNKMVKNYTSLSKEIEVDDCYHCGGKFLDAGELEKIREQYKNSQNKSDEINKEVLNSKEYLKSINTQSTKQYKKSAMKSFYDGIFSKIFSLINK